MTDPTLETQIHAIAPETEVQLTWEDDDTKRSATGTVIDYDPESAFRRIKSDKQDLLLTPSESGIKVTEVTPTTTRPRGTLTDIEPGDLPTETLQITEQGIEVPSYLVGFTGFITAEATDGERTAVIRNPGLQQYDSRVIGLLTLPSTRYHGEHITVRPSERPIRRYRTVDKRDIDDTTREQYRELERLVATAGQLQGAIGTDGDLSSDVREQAIAELHEIQTGLLDARTSLKPPRNESDYDWDSYTSVLKRFEATITALQARLETDETLSSDTKARAENHLQLESHLEALRSLLTESTPNWGVMDD